MCTAALLGGMGGNMWKHEESIRALFSDSIIYHEFDTLLCNPSVPQNGTKITVPSEDIGILIIDV